MFIGREAELRFLEECYSGNGSRMIVLYGREGIGKTELLGQFIKDKPNLYFYAEECSEREQKHRLAEEWGLDVDAEQSSFYDLFLRCEQKQWNVRADLPPRKAVLVLDEFHHAVRGSAGFVAALDALCSEERLVDILLLLVSSSVNWVENDMVKNLGRAALRALSFRKVKEWGFVDLAPRFPLYNLAECIETYAVLGGVPKYLSYWDSGEGFRENVERLLLQKDGILYLETQRFLKSELRELALYNTILTAMASGRTKLADINRYTGFGRAKVSVYIKNLIQLDIVEKVFSYETAGKEHTVKGMYRIRDFFVLFYYRYVFPNRSQLESGSAETVYEQQIAPHLKEIQEICYKKVCQEYLLLMGTHGRLPFTIGKSGSWFGKDGDIDFVAESEDGRWMAAFCFWDGKMTGMPELRQAAARLEQAKVEADIVYLFSRIGFTPELKAKSGGSLKLLSVDEM